MGKYKFRFSDMLPNAWFYKLKDMNNNTRDANQINTKKRNHQPLPTSTFASSSKPASLAKPRKSYYFTRELHSNNNSRGENRPRKSPIQKPKKGSCSSVSARCRVSNESLFTKSEEKSTSSSLSSSSELEFRCGSVLATETFDNMVNMSSPNEKDNIFNVENSSKLDSFSDLELPQIITKPESFTTIKNKNYKKKQNQQPMKSPRIKLRINSPRIGNRNIHRSSVNSTSKLSSSSNRRRSRISESFAIVKSSFDPQRDFRESMIEMIMENNIKASKDLEDLLACYLSLNGDEYHDLIIKVFKQIWFDLTCIKSKYSK